MRAPDPPLVAEQVRPGVWSVASTRLGEPPYEVQWFGRGGGCTCPGFQRWHHCKHLDHVRSLAGARPAGRKEQAMQPPNPRALTRVEPRPLVVEEPSRTLTNLSIQEISQVVEHLEGATGFLPKGITTKGQTFAVILTGQEIGIGPMAAMRHIPLVEGKADPSAELLLALIRHRYGAETIRVAETTAEHCTVEWRQPGWPGVQSFTWTWKDAERAGLTRKDNWQKYPAAMNRSRALKHVARSHFPEVALGLDLGGEDVAEPASVAYRLQRNAADGAAADAHDGWLTAEELQPGGPETGEGVGVVSVVHVRGEVAEGECAMCGAMGEVVDDGEAYVCRDQGACASRCLTREARPAPEAETLTAAALANAKQLDMIQAHLQRTGPAGAAEVAKLGQPVESLSHTDASALIRVLQRLPNATPAEAPSV